MAWRLITITKGMVTTRGSVLYCQRCGRKFEVGEEVWGHQKIRRRRHKTEYYCKKCYKELWI